MKLNKNFEFSLKLIVLVVLIAFLIFDFILQLYAPKKNMEGIPTTERLNIYYSFFTTQSNYCVVIYLIFALFMKRIYNRKCPFGVELAMVVYITVTMIVFWFGLLASIDEFNSYYPPNWVSTIMLHFFIPLTMIGYFIFSCGDNYYCFRKHTKLSLPLTCFYPIGYLIFVMIRGEVRFNYYSPDFYMDIYKNVDNPNSWFWNNVWNANNGVINKFEGYSSQMWYPYWFLNIHPYKLIGKNGVDHSSLGPQWLLILIFVIACIAITSLIIGLQYIYLNWNNNKFYRWHDIEGKLISKIEHDYRKQKNKINKKIAKNELKANLLNKKTEYKIFKKNLKSYDKKEKKLKLKEYNNLRFLKNKLKKAKKINKKLERRALKRQIKFFIASLNYKDKAFIKENLREANRYKKLVEKGVLIFK